MINEYEIKKRLQNGDITALEAVYQEYSNQIFAFSLSICKSRETAEDVTADIFIMLYQYLSADNAISNLKAFIFTACRNKTYDMLKKSSQNEPLPDDDIFIQDELPLDEKIAVTFALERLPADEKEIVSLFCIAGFLHKEIAQMLNMPEGTVRWKYRKAISKLKSLLGGAEND
jgi:RNA polymerase sigma factor (sigma-70 family)